MRLHLNIIRFIEQGPNCIRSFNQTDDSHNPFKMMFLEGSFSILLPVNPVGNVTISDATINKTFVAVSQIPF